MGGAGGGQGRKTVAAKLCLPSLPRHNRPMRSAGLSQFTLPTHRRAAQRP